MLTIRRLIVLIGILVLVGTCTWLLGMFLAPYEAEAELLVRPKSDIELMVERHFAGVTANDDRWAIAQNASKLLRSHTVISKALRREDFKKYAVIVKQDDPVEFVAQRLKVKVTQPGNIVVQMADGHDPQLCAELVNAIVEEYLERFVLSDRDSQFEGVRRLETRLGELTNLHLQHCAELQEVTKALTTTDSSCSVRVERLKVEVEQFKLAASRSHERLVDAQLSDAEVDGNWDLENRQARSKRLEEEYQRNMAKLEKSLELLVVEQRALRDESVGSYTIEIRQLEVERLRRQIDEVSDMLARLRWMQGFDSRIELVSKAEAPLSRRGWFSWNSDTE